ncbi:MAG: trehalose-phosphatase [Acidimicrobiales bacterium]|nr:trehalose-phosphatase [Acidimicrobiales bacterium]
MTAPADALRAVIADAAILTDFDGTLAPIVDEPAAARPLPGAVPALSELAARARIVGVVSGRPVAFIAGHVPDPRIHLSGLYGLERRDAGVVASDPEAERWAAPIAAAATELREALPDGVEVEAKRASVTVHFRRHPDREAAVLAAVADVAGRHGLVTRPARRAAEVHPPVPVDKGTVVEELASGGRAACFLGDDVGDLPAFDALDRLAGKGLLAVRVAVRSPEVSEELVDRADVVVDGPAGAVDWLRGLA